MKRLSFGFVMVSLLCLFFPPAFAADSSSDSSTPYTYGMALDIAKVISIVTPQTITCEIVQSKMTYLDRAAVKRTITYQVHSDACFVGD